MKWLKPLAFYAVLLLIWQAIYQQQWWPPYLFPSPMDVLHSLRQGFQDGSIPEGLKISLLRVLAGYAISLAAGGALGALLAASRHARETAGGLVLSLQSLPSLCWLPLAVLWFGLSEKAILFVVVMGSMLSVTIGTENSLRNVPRIYLLAGKNLGARGPRLFFSVLLPASLPHLIAGWKQGWAFAWRSLISGEMIFVTLGLGQLLMMGRDLNDISQVMAVMLLIMLAGFSCDRLLFGTLERHLRRRWGIADSQ